MKISFDEYCIRSFELADKDSLVKYANNFNVSKNLKDGFPFPYTESNAEEWLMFACNQNPEFSFAIANAEELVGGIGIAPQDDVYRYCAEIGYWLAEPFWGKGIVTNALKEMTNYTFNNFDYNKIFAGVFEGNGASEEVLKKAGYSLEATLKKSVYKKAKFLDQYIYSIFREKILQV